MKLKKDSRISRNFKLSDSITTARQLQNVAGGNGLIYHRVWHRTCPVSFILNMQFNAVMQMINGNYLFQVRRLPASAVKKCPWKRERPVHSVFNIFNPKGISDAEFESIPRYD